MRFLRLSVVAVLLLAGLALPTVSTAAPRPVTPEVETVPVPVLREREREQRVGHDGEPQVLAAALSTGDATFDVVGLTYEGAAPPGLEVEVRTLADGAWSAWTDLEVGGDEGPDPGTAEQKGSRSGTGALVAAGASAAQVRVWSDDGTAPRGLAASLVDGGSAPADRAGGSPGSARASVGAPSIITRAQWGADEGLRPCEPRPMAGFQAAVVHHTVSSNTYSQSQAAGVLRGIYAYHTQGLGWCDVGYQFLVDRFGRIYEGRKGSISGFVQGSHAGGFNTYGVGVSVIGDFTSTAFPSAVAASVSRVIAWQADRSGFDPAGSISMRSFGSTRYPAGTVVTTPRVMGHRDLSLTSCPGDAAFPQVPGIRSGAAAAWRSGQFPASPGRFTNTTPRRILDTRIGLGAPRARVGPGQTVVLTVPGLPSDARTALLNVTAVYPTNPTHIALWPGGHQRRNTSTVNVVPGGTVANLVPVGLGAGNTVQLSNASGWVDLVVDLMGHVRPTAGSLYTPLDPRRIGDSRTGFGGLQPGRPGGVVTLAVPGLPSGTSSVTLNVTGVGATGQSFVTVYGGGSARPPTSNLNLVPGTTTANLVTTPVGAGNTVSIYTDRADVDLVVDLVGHHGTSSSQRLTALSPRRVMDTRYTFNVAGGPVGRSEEVTLSVPGLPSGTRAVVLNLTATGATGLVYVSAYRDGTSRPNTSNLNLGPNQTVANTVVVPVGPGNTVRLYVNGGSVHLIADAVGYYAP